MKKEGLANLTLTGHIGNKADIRKQQSTYQFYKCIEDQKV